MAYSDKIAEAAAELPKPMQKIVLDFVNELVEGVNETVETAAPRGRKIQQEDEPEVQRSRRPISDDDNDVEDRPSRRRVDDDDGRSSRRTRNPVDEDDGEEPEEKPRRGSRRRYEEE